MMRQQNIYKIATWSLLGLNLVMIGFFLLRRPHPHGAAGFRSKAIEILHLGESQEAAFIELAHAHAGKMNDLNKEEGEHLRAYFDWLTQEHPQVAQADALQRALEVEQRKVELTFSHFQDVKALLNADQSAYFKEFVAQALEVLLLRSRDQRPGPDSPK